MARSITWRREFVLAAVAASAALSLAGCGDLYQRDDFVRQVQGKTDTEIQKAIGKPAAVDASNADRVTWTYMKATFDVSQGTKTDAKTIVVLKPESPGGKLKAVEVLYE